MAIKEIAVLGGGNGAFTTAGDMALAGYNAKRLKGLTLSALQVRPFPRKILLN
jgi:hypothetical protein